MKNNTPLVSAIIIFLNEERFLLEAIESVSGQSYDRWELLLVDDGSTDASAEIARGWAEKHPAKVRYLTHDGRRNRGMSASRNLGVRNAVGKYIAYLDGDDVWLANKLEEQVAILESHPEAVMVCGPLLEWHSWNPERKGIRSDRIYGAGPTGHHPFADTIVDPPNLLSLFLRDEEFIPAAALMRRNAIERIGGAEEDFRGSYEDAVTFVKLCRTEKVMVSSSCWYKYRIHPNSCERRAAKLGESQRNRIRYLRWVEGYLIEQGFEDDAVWRALRMSLLYSRHAILGTLFSGKPLTSGSARDGLKLLVRRMLPESFYDELLALTQKSRDVRFIRK